MNLIIFDIDETLADRKTGELLLGIREWWLDTEHSEQFAIATNQGGVGLRYWMEQAGFGDPEQYPTEAQARAHIQRVIDQLHPSFKPYVCFAYQSQRSGKWSPTPPGCEGLPEWNPANRKPAPGMLLQAMKDAGVGPEQTTYVGNDIEDYMAAKAAKCKFRYAQEFFGRGKKVEK